MKTMKTDIPMDATDLTQLSSREQLSALMDSALPADETRFLLRRLQHDASLAECWERWRLSGEVMRGLAPAQRLPADFASRVAASLHGEAGIDEVVEVVGASGKRAGRSPAWLRWGGGAAVAASVAVVALMARPVVLDQPAATAVAITDASPANIANTTRMSQAPVPRTPAPQAPTQDPDGTGIEAQTAALATAVAAAARPLRNSRRATPSRVLASTPAVQTQMADAGIPATNSLPALLPAADITTRPWPRSVLPQYGHAGITVGFGDNARGAVPYNPFQVRTGIGNLPPALMADQQDAQSASTPANDAAGSDASQESPPQP